MAGIRSDRNNSKVTRQLRFRVSPPNLRTVPHAREGRGGNSTKFFTVVFLRSENFWLQNCAILRNPARIPNERNA